MSDEVIADRSTPGGSQVIQSSIIGWVSATLRVFAKAPVFFTALACVQLLAYPLMALTPLLMSPHRGAVELVVAELMFAAVQAPLLMCAIRLLRVEATSFRPLLRLVAGRVPAVVVLTILQVVFAALGFVALVIPGVIVLLAFFVAGPVCVAERAAPMDSLRRSADLTKGHRWRILGAATCLAVPVLMPLAISAFLLPVAVSESRLANVFADLLGAILGAALTILSTVVYEAVRPGADETRIAAVFV